MIKMEVSHHIVGKTLARDVYDPNGNLLLPRGTVVVPQHVRQLLQLEYTEVMIEPPQEKIGSPPDAEKDGGAQFRNTERHNHPLEEVFAETADNFKEMMSKATLGHKIRPQEVEETVDILFPGVMETNNILTNLRNLRSKDEYTLQHSVSVSILSLKMGQIMKFLPDDLKVLGTAAILHDIGKCKIPMDIINKPGRLTEDEFKEIQKHPVFGYKTVQDIQINDPRVMLAVLQHHEHQNGKGYPLKLNAQQIHIFSSIIAVADVFDALTSNRPYRDGESVFEALNEINASSVTHLHPIASRCLRSYILNISPGETVVLNTGEIARVIMANKDEANRPLVQVGDRFINLSEIRYLWVEDFLS